MRATIDIHLQTSAETREQADQLRADIQKQVRDQIKSDMQAARDARDAQSEMQVSNARELGLQVEKSFIDARGDRTASVLVTPTPGNGFRTSVAPTNTGVQTGVTPWDNNTLEHIEDISAIVGVTLVCCVVALPIARAISRWIDRRGKNTTVTSDVPKRLEAIEQAVESVAVEVERISEGQRFTTRVLSERTHEPARDFLAQGGDALPVSSIPANARRG